MRSAFFDVIAATLYVPTAIWNYICTTSVENAHVTCGIYTLQVNFISTCGWHEGMTSAFKAIASSSCACPKWFTEGKTKLIPKQGDFTSENQSPITCLNTSYKWFTSCILGPTEEHLNVYDLMEKQQRGAKAGCSGTIDNLPIDRTVTLDCHSYKHNLSVAWVDVRKAYDSVDHR